MWRDGWRGGRRMLALAGLMVLALPAHGVAQNAPKETGGSVCPGADRPIGELGSAGARTALRCLVAAERKAAGVGSLRQSTVLRRIALSLARDQVRRGYRGHVSPDGEDLQDRVRRIGGKAFALSRWEVAECIGWVTGQATPAALAQSMLDSPSHRRLLLGKRFRYSDVGVAGAGDEAVAVIELARRR